MKLSESRLSARYKFFFFSVVMVSFVFLIHMYVLLPQNLRITELKTAKMEFEQRIVSIQDFSKRNPDTNRYLAEIDKKAALLDAMLPNSADLSGFLTQLEQAAADAGLQLSEIKPGQTVSKAGYQEVTVEVNIRGTFLQILAFLRKLDTMERFNIVNSIGIKSHQGMLEGRLTVVIYCFSESSRTQIQQTKQ